LVIISVYLILSTSLNPKSRSRVLAREFDRRLRAMRESVTLYDLQEHKLPMCDGGACYGDPETQHLASLVNAAKGIIVATPVYNYDVSATAKNVVELTGRAWSEKVVGFVCAAGGGVSYMAVMGMANSLMLDFHSFILPRFLFATGKAFDEHNRLNDEDVSQRLDNLVSLLVRTTEALHPGERPAS
jgi:FMN reductase